MTLLQPKKIEEGEVFCLWLKSRLLTNNKNVLSAELGPTGSGKSYRDLRKVELWYRNYLKREFPIKNICFGVGELMKRINSKELKRGDILIFEEAGANLGSLDFQSKVSKMFTYVLQAFRSLNIGIFFNLPYLSMLNKQARMLMHYSGESDGINFETKQNICRPKFHQVNQGNGKIYKKYLRVIINGKSRKIQRMAWNMPSKWLRDAYEQKKHKFLTDMTEDYTRELDELEKDKLRKLGRKDLSEPQQEVYEDWLNDLSIKESAKKRGCSTQNVGKIRKTIKNYGYKTPKKKKH